MTDAFCFTFSQKLEANGKGDDEIKYFLGMLYKIRQKIFGCQCPLTDVHLKCNVAGLTLPKFEFEEDCTGKLKISASLNCSQ